MVFGQPLTPFDVGDRPKSINERDALDRVAQIERGNAFLAAWRHDVALERMIAKETR